jgi:hypothetical protein
MKRLLIPCIAALLAAASSGINPLVAGSALPAAGITAPSPGVQISSAAAVAVSSSPAASVAAPVSAQPIAASSAPAVAISSAAVAISSASVAVSSITAVAPADPCAGNGIPVEKVEGYSLSVDGQVLAGNGLSVQDPERCQDARLAQAGIRIQSDGNVSKKLDLGIWPSPAYKGLPVYFTAYWNYSHWIRRAEVRIFPKGVSVKSVPLEIIPLDDTGRATWTPEKTELSPAFQAVLRVYDENGLFDETQADDIKLNPEGKPEGKLTERERNAAYGKNRLALDRIRAEGTMITVSGENIKPGNAIHALGRDVPLDEGGKFAVEEILPPGRHDVGIRVDGANPMTFLRPVYVPYDRWFYIAMADITMGQNQTSGPVELVENASSDYSGSIYADGRLAFYLKGMIKGDWLITASADTKEQPLSTIFTNMDAKDPQYLLRKLDPTQFYPVYGDDSTMIEDAPTQGKFYVRVERGDTKVLWGNFAVRIGGNDLVTIDRAMYGGYGRTATRSVTKYGEKKASVQAYAGDPGTLSAREEFRGTGGSLYYLQHMNITAGSDIVTVEVRDKNSGIVLQTKGLADGQDYELDTLQGRIVLSQPLASTVVDNNIVQNNALDGNPEYLVVRYEYQPGTSDLSDLATGGRAEAWLGDHVLLGATGATQKSDGDNNSLAGFDSTVRLTPQTYLKGQVAQSDGLGIGGQSSSDGGFNFSSLNSTITGDPANAVQVEGATQFSDLKSSWSGHMTGYWKKREAGFSGPGQIASLDTEQLGGELVNPLPFHTQLDTKYDQTIELGGGVSKTLNVNMRKTMGQHWSTELGVQNTYTQAVASSSSTITSGGNTNKAALRLTYDNLKSWSAYAFGQANADAGGSLQDGTGGAGGKLKLTDRWALTGEATTGDGSTAAKFGSEERLNERTTLYSTYQVSTDRTDNDVASGAGQFVSGVRTRYSDSASIFGEEKWQNGNGESGLTHSYGLDVAELDGWHWGMTGEYGTLNQSTNTITRTALSGSVGITRRDFKWTSALEYRGDDGASLEQTWLTRNSLNYQVHKDWRLLTKISYSISTNSQGDYETGQFTEGTFGFAYRPVENDRFNALFKYTYLSDLASTGQLTDSGTSSDYMQRSHVLSADADYDIIPQLTLGGKYAFRISQVRIGRTGDNPWFTSNASLGILRLDWHMFKKWDALAEGRLLTEVEADDSRGGALLGIYRHLNDNVKLGAGYNFTDYSDDLTDMSYKSYGWFVNFLAAI